MFVSLSDSKELIPILSSKLGVDYDKFCVSFFRRRLSYSCEILNIKRKQQLVDMLEQPSFCDQLLYHMTVPGSEMFRDPGFWRSLRLLLGQKDAGKNLKVLFPDASGSEDLYSFVILAQQMGIRDKIDILVQHPSRLVVEEIKSGVVSAKSIKTNLSNFERLETKDDFESFFADAEKDYLINPTLLSNVRFEQKWFASNDTKGLYDLIFFRNSGLVLSKSFHEHCCSQLIGQLTTGGVLTIGVQENLSDELLQEVTCVNADERIFEKPIV